MKIDTETDEGKAQLQKLIDEATTGLKSKNEELLGLTKKLKEEMKSTTDRLDAIAKEKEEAEAAAAAKGGDVEKVKETLTKQHKSEMEKLTANLSDTQSKLNKVLIENGLTDALTKAGVAPQYLDAAKALLTTKHKAEVADDNGNPVARIEGKAISEFVSEWTQGDQGKHFKAAANNGGGGANGQNGNAKGGAAKTMSRADFEAMSAIDKITFSKEGGTLTQ